MNPYINENAGRNGRRIRSRVSLERATNGLDRRHPKPRSVSWQAIVPPGSILSALGGQRQRPAVAAKQLNPISSSNAVRSLSTCGWAPPSRWAASDTEPVSTNAQRACSPRRLGKTSPGGFQPQGSPHPIRRVIPTGPNDFDGFHHDAADVNFAQTVAADLEPT